MVMKVVLFNEEGIKERTDLSFKDIDEYLKDKKEILNMIPTRAILKSLSCLGKEMIKDKELLSQEGIFYLASWLRESNIETYLNRNFKNKDCLDKFVELDNEIYIKAQPRGLVCHWIAENVPTLAAFSLFQSIVCRNTNVLKISEYCLKDLQKIVEKLRNIEVEHEGKIYRGESLLETFVFVDFDYHEQNLGKEMSKIADCRVIFGGREAIETILSFPQKSHCETIIFGPKYSFAVLDSGYLQKSKRDIFKKLVMDIIVFNQTACSSPHVLFYERTNADSPTLKEISSRLMAAFEEICLKYVKKDKNPGILTKIINKRGEYYLDPAKSVMCSKELDWTILIDNSLCLEEPIGSRTIFLKEVKSVLDVVPLITEKVQTIGAGLENIEKLIKFSNKASLMGAARIVPIGKMNDYDAPWDGMLFISRLIRLCLIKKPIDEKTE